MELEQSNEGFVDITGDGGILKKILTSGNGEIPSDGDNVEAHYTGKVFVISFYVI